MKIKMLETRRGTEDGFTIKTYLCDEEYDVCDFLGKSFFAAGFANIVEEKKAKRKAAPKKKKATSKIKLFSKNGGK